jgi:predicted O-methyltransferase YrrM
MAPFVFRFAPQSPVDLRPHAEYLAAPWSGFLQEPAGKEHHQLLAALSRQLPKGSVALDVGTYMGASAAALASNPDVTVHTYDIFDNLRWQAKSIRDLRNVVIHVEDGSNAFTKENLDGVKLILIDVDPHDGVQEKVMIDKLLRAEYKGLLLLDDIHLNPQMQALWDWIPSNLAKYDATVFGHHSGTGVVLFDPSVVAFENSRE